MRYQESKPGAVGTGVLDGGLRIGITDSAFLKFAIRNPQAVEPRSLPLPVLTPAAALRKSVNLTHCYIYLYGLYARMLSFKPRCD